MHYYPIACCTRLPRWQDCCYRAARELCSNYFIVLQCWLNSNFFITEFVLYFCFQCYFQEIAKNAAALKEVLSRAAELEQADKKLVASRFANTIELVLNTGSPMNERGIFMTLLVVVVVAVVVVVIIVVLVVVGVVQGGPKKPDLFEC